MLSPCHILRKNAKYSGYTDRPTDLLDDLIVCVLRGVVEMGSRPLIEEKKIEDTIRNVPKSSFTVLEFIDVFKRMYPREWEMLVGRFGVFGSKRRYTVSTYLSNRLDVYSHKPHSILVPFTRWSEGGFKDRRRTTKEEKKVFGSHWISVFRKKKDS